MQEKVCVKVKIFIFPCSGRPEEWLVGLLITTFMSAHRTWVLSDQMGNLEIPNDWNRLDALMIGWMTPWLRADLTFTHWVLGLRNRCGPLFSLLPSLFKDPCTGCIQDTKNIDKATGHCCYPQNGLDRIAFCSSTEVTGYSILIPWHKHIATMAAVDWTAMDPGYGFAICTGSTHW